jgi:hypothetical protein
MSLLRVFLDSSALKMAVQRRIIRRRRRKTLDWGNSRTTADIVQFITVDPTIACQRRQRREARRLPVIAWLSLQGRVDLLAHAETLWEFFGLPRTDDAFGRFFGATIALVKNPFHYGRILVGGYAPSPSELGPASSQVFHTSDLSS